MRPKLLRPVVELFSDGEVLDVNMLHRHGAFSTPQVFPLRRLKTYLDRSEIYFRDRARPPQIVLIERTGLHLGGARPWFVCQRNRGEPSTKLSATPCTRTNSIGLTPPG